MSSTELGIGVADISGFLALFFIIATAFLMFGKKRLSKGANFAHQTFLNRVHIVVATLGGAFLLLHADYFIKAPINNPGILIGYVSTAVALVVWFTGFSFLERLKYSLLYHGSLSLFAISLMVIHSIYLGFNVPVGISEAILAGVVVITFVRAIQHVTKLLSNRTKKLKTGSPSQT